MRIRVPYFIVHWFFHRTNPIPACIVVSTLVMSKLMTVEELPGLLTMKQACDFLNCHPNTLRNWDRAGRLIAVRFGSRGDRRFKKEDILKLLEPVDEIEE